MEDFSVIDILKEMLSQRGIYITGMSIPYEQLTFTNQFMFEKVLTCPENKNFVRRIIEMAIGEEVEDIQLV